MTPVEESTNELKELKQQIEFVTGTKLKEVQEMQEGNNSSLLLMYLLFLKNLERAFGKQSV